MRRRILLMLLAASLPCFSQGTDETGLVPLSERMQDIYAATKPDGYLIDPQRLLRGGEARERREFLKYHSGDSLIDLYVVLFKGDQLIYNPGDLSSHLLNSRSISKPAVVVHYFMGRPDRAELHLSPQLQEVVAEEERWRALESAVEHAQTGVSPVDELKKFMLQTTIRIIRMEGLLRGGAASLAPLVHEQPKEADAHQQEGEAVVKQLFGFWNEQKFKLIGSTLLLAVVWLLLRWRKQHATYEFPDSDVEERLGGAHGAGIGAVIEFGKSSPPPAAQLEKLKLH